jgi:ABC-2 type transport system permease protein
MTAATLGIARRDLVAVARLELAEVLRSRWLIFCTAVYAVVAAVFVLVGMRESNILGFTGMGRVLLSFCHALVLLLPLLALSATGQIVNRARDDGTMELLFSHPLSRTGYFAGITITRYLALVAPLAATVLVMALLGRAAFGQAIPWGFVFRTLAVSASLLAAFVGIGLAISTLVRNQARATMYVLLAWAIAVALLDFALIGVLLQWRLNPRVIFLLASLNPVETARVALLSGAEPELPALGPVGFYLATRLGDGLLLVAGIVWPALLGVGAWLLSLRAFRRGDLV